MTDNPPKRRLSNNHGASGKKPNYQRSQQPSRHGFPPVPPPQRGQRPKPYRSTQFRSAQPPKPPRQPIPTPPQTSPPPETDLALSISPASRLASQPPPAETPSDPQQNSLLEGLKLSVNRFVNSWQFWSLSGLALFSSLGIISAISLFRIPNLPNCRAIFWPTAPASTRLQCAEAYASQGTEADLLAAIDLVNSLPADHPLRAEINQNIERWAKQVLNRAEQTFHAGELNDAIAIAQKIPAHTAAAALVEARIERWRVIWDQAEELYLAAEAELQRQHFREAFNLAVRLLSVGNDYWETTRYEELTHLITQAREDVSHVARARRLGKQGSLSNVLEAIKLMSAIDADSHVHEEAQRLLKQFSRDMLDLAEAALKQQKDAEQARKILAEIPDRVDLGGEISDFQIIIDAYRRSWGGDVASLETAIVRLQSISRNRPLYAKAQQLISYWQAEIQGISKLEWARHIAEPGTISDLSVAIAEAEQISRSNPVWDMAKQEIDHWSDQIETLQDRPFLDRAEQLAYAGHLLAAITAAKNIAPGRALYDEANQRIRDWRGKIQRIEDQPLLNHARSLAEQGDLYQAIAVANQIGSDRVLYEEAQTEVTVWRRQIQAQRNLQDAYRTAETGSPNALADAILVANQVPESSATYRQAITAINQWSWDILRLAETEAPYNLENAIEMAQEIPPLTPAYAEAQLRIQVWQTQLEEDESDKEEIEE